MSEKKYKLVSGSLFDDEAVKTATQTGGLEDTLFNGPKKDQQDSIPANQPGEKIRPKRGRPRNDTPPPETKKATYYLERSTARALNIYAAEQERSASDIVSEAIKAYLRKHGKDV